LNTWHSHDPFVSSPTSTSHHIKYNITMTSFSSLPFEIKSRIVEIYLIASAESAAANQQPSVDGGRDFNYWRFKAGRDIWPLNFTSIELHHEVKRIATRLENDWREELNELKLRNPCNSSHRRRRVNDCYGLPGSRFRPPGRQLCKDCSRIHTVSAKMCHIYWAMSRDYLYRPGVGSIEIEWCSEYDLRAGDCKNVSTWSCHD